MAEMILELYVEPIYIAELLIELSQIDGIEVRLPTRKLTEPDETKVHGHYSLSFAELAAVIISLSGAATGLTSVATAILQYKAAKAATTELVEKQKIQAPVVKINNTFIVLDDFSEPEMLAEYLEKKLNEDSLD